MTPTNTYQKFIDITTTGTMFLLTRTAFMPWQTKVATLQPLKKQEKTFHKVVTASVELYTELRIQIRKLCKKFGGKSYKTTCEHIFENLNKMELCLDSLELKELLNQLYKFIFLMIGSDLTEAEFDSLMRRYDLV